MILLPIAKNKLFPRILFLNQLFVRPVLTSLEYEMLRAQSTKLVFLLVTVFGFGVSAFAQRSTDDQTPAVAVSQNQPVQVAATQAANGQRAVIAATPGAADSASSYAQKCVGPVSFCHIYFGN
ncbi:hypothetical protein [Paraburkholderia sacchari]|uniref:hypothetical protein n=1 Tax=Paraburkholderia sacchari TaxID=159450 RepID=UPI003D96C49C